MDSKSKWCFEKQGLMLIDPNEVLSKEYILAAEETLSEIKNTNSNMWKSVMKYYFEYFCIYSVLMKIGIKSTIHDCTIEVAKLLEENKVIPKGFANILLKDKELREENQYYLKNVKTYIDYDSLLFILLKIKGVNLTQREINKLRELIRKQAI